jgi:uncharacterized protein (DUF433 family)
MDVDVKQHIESNPKIMFGKPVVKGTRIPVDIVLEKLCYHSFENILMDYPMLQIEDIMACLNFIPRG